MAAVVVVVVNDGNAVIVVALEESLRLDVVVVARLDDSDVLNVDGSWEGV